MNIYQVIRNRILILCFSLSIVSLWANAEEETVTTGIEIIENSPSLEVPKWSDEFEEADIVNNALFDFLKEHIVPYFKKNTQERKGEDRLHLWLMGKTDESKESEEVMITAHSKCSWLTPTERRFNNPNEYNTTYVTVISGTVVFIIDYTNDRKSSLIRPNGRRYKPNRDYWKPSSGIFDEEALWWINVSDDRLILDEFKEGQGNVFDGWKIK